MKVRTKKQEVRKRNVGLRSKRFEVRSYMLEFGSKTSDEVKGIIETNFLLLS